VHLTYPLNGLSGRKITSLGVLYDFTDNDVGTTVQKVADMVNETWVLVSIPAHLRKTH
jgi:hypothetical protein